MTRFSFRSSLAILALAGLLTASLPADTWARAGGGTSSGSRGSRSFSSPSRTYSAPAPSPSTQPTPAPAPAPMAQPAPAGGFLRSMAGGIVGGLLGGMLFRSLGFAGGTGGADGAGGGGFGMMDLFLLAGVAYLIYWVVRRMRARQAVALAGGPLDRSTVEPSSLGAAPTATLDVPNWQQDRDRGLGHIRQLDPGFDEAAFRELCTDRFFQIQAAWMRRDLDKLRPLLTEEMQGVFGKQIAAAKAQRQLNKLENITVRSVELTEVWQESGQEYITVRLLANLLDYTVDDTTGQIVDGSDSAPVKFEEFWTWVRPVGKNDWRLGAINQAD